MSAGQKYGFIVEHPDGDCLISDPYAKGDRQTPSLYASADPFQGVFKSLNPSSLIAISIGKESKSLSEAKKKWCCLKLMSKELTRLNPEVESRQQELLPRLRIS